MSKSISAALLICVLLLLPACARKPAATDAYSGYGTPGSVQPSATASSEPGRTPKRGGRLELIGTLQRDDSGAWLVVAARPAGAASGTVIGVLVNSGPLSKVDLPALENSYVRVTGTAADGIATDKTGLGVIADTVTRLGGQ